jgi:hypothetical protein
MGIDVGHFIAPSYSNHIAYAPVKSCSSEASEQLLALLPKSQSVRTCEKLLEVTPLSDF